MRLRTSNQCPVLSGVMRYLRALLLLFGVFALSACAADGIRPFTSDGCSAFPDGTLAEKNLWLACCTTHDLAYWQGGTRAQRAEADRALRQCVEELGQPGVALLMQAGVRLGGTPYMPTTFRWGYGWPFPRGYKAISSDEKQQVQSVLMGSE